MAEPFASEARQLESARPLRFRARRAARRLTLTGLTALPRRSRPGVRIIHYHHVFDDERERFVKQLLFLAREFEPVSLTEGVARLEKGQSTGRELVVTFDDGFRNGLENAAPLLAEHGFQACFFVVTGFLSATTAEAALICRERLHLPRPVEPLRWNDLQRLIELGHEVGSHTRTHPNLSELDPAALRDELTVSRTELEQRLGIGIEHFSAPYGDRRRFPRGVSHAAREAGYASCASAIRGRNVSANDVYALRREHLIAGWPIRELRWFLG